MDQLGFAQNDWNRMFWSKELSKLIKIWKSWILFSKELAMQQREGLGCRYKEGRTGGGGGGLLHGSRTEKIANHGNENFIFKLFMVTDYEE